MFLFKTTSFVSKEETLVQAGGIQELQSWGIHSTLPHAGCPESVRPFWKSREPVAWPWCNLAASQRRPQCSSANSPVPWG